MEKSRVNHQPRKRPRAKLDLGRQKEVKMFTYKKIDYKNKLKSII
jgi:hypothetical protein